MNRWGSVCYDRLSKTIEEDSRCKKRTHQIPPQDPHLRKSTLDLKPGAAAKKPAVPLPRWEMVDLNERVIKICGDMTKNKEPRTIYLEDELLTLMKPRMLKKKGCKGDFYGA
jgi:hypothetical protein